MGILSCHVSAQGEITQVQVIVNASVETEEIDVEQARRIFSMRQTAWRDNQKITVFVLASKHKTHQIFTTQVLGVFPYQLERIWNKLVYSGLGEEPIQVNSEQEMIERVSKQSGSIGYVLQHVENVNIKTVNLVKE
ncbi:hypothetical protein [Paraglaciecola sp. L3A3]|uniref:hypothetical protein n=1 Tax=Paraglaciecola sp. L3A3 TaxID=2686358 RepID=UPI001E2B6689|nr:hypothetical protein [Paraglaciecola sp. L3A3]